MQLGEQQLGQALQTRVTAEGLEVNLESQVGLEPGGEFHGHQRIEAQVEQGFTRIDRLPLGQAHYLAEPPLQQLGDQGHRFARGRRRQAGEQALPGRLCLGRCRSRGPAAALLHQGAQHGSLAGVGLVPEARPIVIEHGDHAALAPLQQQIQGLKRPRSRQQSYAESL